MQRVLLNKFHMTAREHLLRKNASLTVPEKYLRGLDTKERNIRALEIQRGKKTQSDDPSAYDAERFTTDFYANGKRRETKPSTYTLQFYSFYPNAISLEEKAHATGVPIDILEKVYRKGLAAYRTGHRPGATQGQWAYARVHSFLVKGCTFYNPDHLLAAEAIKRSDAAQKHFQKMKCSCWKICKY